MVSLTRACRIGAPIASITRRTFRSASSRAASARTSRATTSTDGSTAGAGPRRSRGRRPAIHCSAISPCSTRSHELAGRSSGPRHRTMNRSSAPAISTVRRCPDRPLVASQPCRSPTAHIAIAGVDDGIRGVEQQRTSMSLAATSAAHRSATVRGWDARRCPSSGWGRANGAVPRASGRRAPLMSPKRRWPRETLVPGRHRTFAATSTPSCRFTSKCTRAPGTRAAGSTSAARAGYWRPPCTTRPSPGERRTTATLRQASRHLHHPHVGAARRPATRGPRPAGERPSGPGVGPGAPSAGRARG